MKNPYLSFTFNHLFHQLSSDIALTLFFFQGMVAYVGKRRRTRDVLQRHMYASEISQWMQEAEEEERNDINNIIEEAQINARLIAA